MYSTALLKVSATRNGSCSQSAGRTRPGFSFSDVLLAFVFILLCIEKLPKGGSTSPERFILLVANRLRRVSFVPFMCASKIDVADCTQNVKIAFSQMCEAWPIPMVVRAIMLEKLLLFSPFFSG